MAEPRSGEKTVTVAENLDAMIRIAEELRATGPPIVRHELGQVLSALRVLRDEIDPLGR